MSDTAYDIKSIAMDLMRVADFLDRHNQIQAAILAEMRALRITNYSDDWDAADSRKAADRLTADALDEEDEG
jgi:hypothetical protein